MIPDISIEYVFLPKAVILSVWFVFNKNNGVRKSVTNYIRIITVFTIWIIQHSVYKPQIGWYKN